MAATRKIEITDRFGFHREGESHHWFSVSSPAVFKEYRLPANPANWTNSDKRKHKALRALAEIHGAPINRNGYRTG